MVTELSSDELNSIVTSLNKVNVIMRVERGLEELLNLPESAVTISELPHIDRVKKPRDALVYELTDNSWRPILNLFPEKVTHFENTSFQEYALRVCVQEKYRREAFKRSGEVLNYLLNEL